MGVEESGDGVGLVGGAVVEDEVKIQLGGRVLVDLSQEGEELFGPMALCDPTQDLARGDIEGSVETGS
jgi:hypothetical protein